MTLFTNISLLLCGLSLFLYGMQQGEKYLRKIGGSDLKRIIAIITKNRISAFFSGLVMTLTTQSSSATTVMLVGLVSSGFMTIGQAIGMILGSDLGTTITVQLFAIKFQKLSPLIITTGFLISIIPKSMIVKGYGKLLLALGLIFFGMQMMSDAVVPLQQHNIVNVFFQQSLINPVLGLIVGTFLTAMIHSSAATLAILIGIVTALQGSGSAASQADLFPIIMGANLGTCSTAFISMFATSHASGRRVAWAHFIFKLIGVAVLFPVNMFFPFSSLLSAMSIPVKIALLHTFFNGFISMLILPFTPAFEKMLLWLVRDKEISGVHHLEFIATADAAIPSIALSQSLKEILRMTECVTQMLEMSHSLLGKYNSTLKGTIAQKEELVDYLRENVVAFLIRISHGELQASQARRSHELVMITSDLENMADIIDKRVVHLVEKIITGSTPLSADGKNELLQFYSETVTRFKQVSAFLVMQDEATARSIREYGTGSTYMHLFEQHLERLFKNTPESVQTTSIHLDLLDEIRRLNHYTDRIAVHIAKMSSKSSHAVVELNSAAV